MKYKNITISKRADGRYIGIPTINGKKYYIYGKTQKECYNNLKLFYKEPRTSLNNEISLYTWLDKWYKEYKEPHLKEKSLYQIRNILKTHIKKNIENYKLKDLKVIDIEKAINKVETSRMQEYTYQEWCDILRTAYQNNLLKEDYSKFLVKRKHTRIEGVALTNEQRTKLIEISKTTPHGYIFEFYLYSGARRTELLTLKWEDIKEETIFIRGTKTIKSERYIPKFKALENILNNHKNNSEYVFNFSDSTLKREVELINKLCCFKWTIKDLRTTFATMCAEKGIAESVIAKWMGHTKTLTTKQYYIKVLNDFEKEQKAIFEETKFD